MVIFVTIYVFYTKSYLASSPILNLKDRVSVFMSVRDTAAKLHPQALGSHFIASYDSQIYGGGIPTRLHTGK
jgi:hypothetical protein